MLLLQKKEIIDFRTFMKREKNDKKISEIKPITETKLYSFLPTMTPQMFIDKNFIILAGCVLVVALIEKQLARRGYTAIAQSLYIVLKIAFPIVVFLSLYYLISELSFL